MTAGHVQIKSLQSEPGEPGDQRPLNAEVPASSTRNDFVYICIYILHAVSHISMHDQYSMQQCTIHAYHMFKLDTCCFIRIYVDLHMIEHECDS